MYSILLQYTVRTAVGGSDNPTSIHKVHHMRPFLSLGHFSEQTVKMAMDTLTIILKNV